MKLKKLEKRLKPETKRMIAVLLKEGVLTPDGTPGLFEMNLVKAEYDDDEDSYYMNEEEFANPRKTLEQYRADFTKVQSVKGNKSYVYKLRNVEDYEIVAACMFLVTHLLDADSLTYLMTKNPSYFDKYLKKDDNIIQLIEDEDSDGSRRGSLSRRREEGLAQLAQMDALLATHKKAK